MTEHLERITLIELADGMVMLAEKVKALQAQNDAMWGALETIAQISALTFAATGNDAVLPAEVKGSAIMARWNKDTASVSPNIEAEALAKKFREASQAERLADPKLNSAAEVLALGINHIDAAHKPDSPENARTVMLFVDTIANNIAQGKVYAPPAIQRNPAAKDKGQEPDR